MNILDVIFSGVLGFYVGFWYYYYYVCAWVKFKIVDKNLVSRVMYYWIAICLYCVPSVVYIERGKIVKCAEG
jgi:hypothetical protein